MKNAILQLPKSSKLAIKKIYDQKKNFKTGIEYANIVVEKTVFQKDIDLSSVFQTLEAALKAATIESEWLDLLLITTQELSNGLSNQNKIKQDQKSSKQDKKSKSKKKKRKLDKS